MNEKVKEFLDTKKEEANKLQQEKKQKTLIELNLYEKVYAPVTGYGHTEEENKTVKFPISNKDVKVGDKIKLAKNGEKIDVIVDKIETEYNSEYPYTEWDQSTSSSKYYKKVPVDVTDEEYEEILKYSSLSNKNPISLTLTICSVIVYIIGFISGIVLGDTLSPYDFSFGIALAVWMTAFINGTVLLAISELINLLKKISDK